MMFFSFNTKSKILIKEIDTTYISGLVAGILLTACLALVFESLHMLEYKAPPLEGFKKKKSTKTGRVLLLVRSTALHTARMVIGYTMMLCVMSMNTWIFVSVGICSTVGYFLFKPWSDPKEAMKSKMLKNEKTSLVRESDV